MGNALYDGPGYRYEARGTVGSQVAGHYFSAATLQVRRFLSRVMSLRSVRECFEADPKTKKSRRSIILAPFALSALKQLLVRHVEGAKLDLGGIGHLIHRRTSLNSLLQSILPTQRSR